MRNTGHKAQKDWEAIINRLGKRAFFHRFMDASDVKGLTGKVANVCAQPSDYILVVDGKTEFAEVKSTVHPTSFSFSMLEHSQSGAALQITAAGGEYVAYVKSLSQSKWFRVPYSLIRATTGRSLKWTFLEDKGFEWLPAWT